MRVVIGMPSGEDIRTDTALCMEAMVVHEIKRGEHEIIRASSRSACPDQNQNHMIWNAIHKEDADAIMLVDSDMVFPNDTLERMLTREVPHLGVPYRVRQWPHKLALGTDEPIPLDQEGVRVVKWLPSGMILIRRPVLDAIGYPWMETRYGSCPDERVGHDVSLGLKSLAAGFPVHADFDLAREIFHIGLKYIGLLGELGA